MFLTAALHDPIVELLSQDELFLDIDPLNPLAATLERTAYSAEPTADGVLSYRATALLDPGAGRAVPRIGLQGTARITGAPVSLAMFLFRRPISAARQFLGL